jgi:hypothetical protein
MLSLWVFFQVLIAQALYLDVAENAAYTVTAESVFFLGHSTSIWDPAFKTQVAHKKLLELRKKYQMYTVATVYPYFLKTPQEASSHYFTNQDVDLVVSSVAGQHSGEFPNLKKIFVTGGNIGKCLCEGVRDIVRAVAGKDVIDIYLVRDGIYDSYPLFSPMQKEQAVNFVQRFYVSSFNCLQNWYLKPRLKLPDTKIAVYFDGEKLAELNAEAQSKVPLDSLTKTINLRFIENQDVEKYLH